LADLHEGRPQLLQIVGEPLGGLSGTLQARARLVGEGARDDQISPSIFQEQPCDVLPAAEVGRSEFHA
jgi:hypothetical protein